MSWHPPSPAVLQAERERRRRAIDAPPPDPDALIARTFAYACGKLARYTVARKELESERARLKRLVCPACAADGRTRHFAPAPPPRRRTARVETPATEPEPEPAFWSERY